MLHKKCSLESLEDVTGHMESCPHCQSKSFYKWEVRANLQCYRCKICHKTFKALTNTPLARLRHKEVWIDYAQDVIAGKSIQSTAKHCKVADSTAFRWRHRMLKTPIELKAKHLHGIVEFETAVLIIRDRNGNTSDAILETSNKDTLSEVLIPLIDKDTLLCSDTKISYTALESTTTPKRKNHL